MNHQNNINEDNLRKYLTEFFDNNFLRDFRPRSFYFKDDKVNTYSKNIRISSDSHEQHQYFFRKINEYNDSFSDMFAELYPCQNIQDFQDKCNKKRNPNKVVDRLYFDFDFNTDEHPRAKELKKELLLAVAKGDRNSLFDNQLDEYINGLLLGEKIALEPYEDMMKLYEYLEVFDIKSYPVFSGSKGFHLYIFFPATTELTKDSTKYLSTRIAETYAKSCDLKTIDFSVNRDAYSRLSRLPYCRHPITLLCTYPIDINDSYEKIIHKSLFPEIKKFKITEYKESEGNKALKEHLLVLNNEYMKNQKAAEKNKDKLKEIRATKKSKKYNGKIFNKQDSIFSDCRILAKEFLGEPDSYYDNYVTYICPFHDDHNPSLSVYEKNFVCGCFGTMNYFEFIKKIKGFSTDEEVKKFMRENGKKK